MDKLKREWKSDMETYDKLINKEKELHEIMIKCMVERDKLFEDMDISEDTKYQKNLISLINNVMWERKISLKQTEHSLEISFTPKIQRMLKDNDKDN